MKDLDRSLNKCESLTLINSKTQIAEQSLLFDLSFKTYKDVHENDDAFINNDTYNALVGVKRIPTVMR